MAQKISKHNYDVAIVGGSLSALIAAHLFKSHGKTVVLISPEAELGGEFKNFAGPNGPISQGIDYLPDFPRTDAVLKELSHLMNQNLFAHRFDLSPVTFESGDFKDFNGFGKDAPFALEPVTSFIRSSHFQRLNFSLGDWVSQLADSLEAHEKVFEHVTKIIDSDPNHLGIELNGQKMMAADQVFFALHPTQLTQLVDSPHVQLRLNQKLNKRGFWTSIRITLVHSEIVSTNECVHLLMGAKKDPVVGIFDRVSQVDSEDGAHQTFQTSRWVSFIPHDVTEDAEFVAQTMREMKKQILRAYPQALNNLKFERVRVGAADWGPVGEILAGDIQIKRLNRLWLSGGMFSTVSGLLAELEQPLKAFKLCMGIADETSNVATEQSL